MIALHFHTHTFVQVQYTTFDMNINKFHLVFVSSRRLLRVAFAPKFLSVAMRSLRSISISQETLSMKQRKGCTAPAIQPFDLFFNIQLYCYFPFNPDCKSRTHYTNMTGTAITQNQLLPPSSISLFFICLFSFPLMPITQHSYIIIFFSYSLAHT